MDPIAGLLITLGAIGAILLLLRLFGPPFHVAMRSMERGFRRRRTQRREVPDPKSQEAPGEPPTTPKV